MNFDSRWGAGIDFHDDDDDDGDDEWEVTCFVALQRFFWDLLNEVFLP